MPEVTFPLIATERWSSGPITLNALLVPDAPPLVTVRVSPRTALEITAPAVFETPLTKGAGEPVSWPDESDQDGPGSEYDVTVLLLASFTVAVTVNPVPALTGLVTVTTI